MVSVVWVWVWVLVVVAICAVAAVAVYRLAKSKCSTPAPTPVEAKPPENNFKISYVPSDMQWSGSTAEALPLKTLTFKQYECLEDARYGFKIIGATPSERKLPQAHKTRAHGLKTVSSLAKHGFLTTDDHDGYLINDRGLNALEVCDVRY